VVVLPAELAQVARVIAAHPEVVRVLLAWPDLALPLRVSIQTIVDPAGVGKKG
jgi:hypothetical protein